MNVERLIQIAAGNVRRLLAKSPNGLDDAAAGVIPENAEEPNGE